MSATGAKLFWIVLQPSNLLLVVLALGVLLSWGRRRAWGRALVSLVLLAFAVIGALLVLHYRSGLRGQRAARLVLLAYLLLTLAYPGVKFVTDVVIG